MIMEKSMGDIFINYRREDSSPYAGRLYDFLRLAFPDNKVFIDVDSIDPGEDFVDAINTTLAVSRVVIAVIGPNWTDVIDKAGNRRLDDPDDYVVRELSVALKSSMRVIPVLVGGAQMPQPDLLPRRLESLARKNPIVITDTHFVSNAKQLATSIARFIHPAEKDVNTQCHQTKQPFSLASNIADGLKTLKTLVWTNYALGILWLSLDIIDLKDDTVYLIYIALLLLLIGFAAWFNVMLLRGKNWARTVYFVFFVLGLSNYLFELQNYSSTENILNSASFMLSLLILYIMFTEPVKQFYLTK
jgi:hypothetical protein